MYVSHNEPQICHLNTNYTSANTIVSTTSHQATLAHNYFTKPRRRVALDRWGERYKTSVEKKKRRQREEHGGGGAQSCPYGTVTWPIYHRKRDRVCTGMDST